jgi:hypothetical protein
VPTGKGSLNGEPGELDACPGSTRPVAVPQLTLGVALVPGWPVVGFCCAEAMPVGTVATPRASVTTQNKRRPFFMTGSSRSWGIVPSYPRDTRELAERFIEPSLQKGEAANGSRPLR